mmetsp:Transcript_5472/g.6363  ORF Transcript_5472/g.6363 Transcript_5472/m.6363 type:complete len:628 (+) Transcript_5472:48-1931(+)
MVSTTTIRAHQDSKSISSITRINKSVMTLEFQNGINVIDSLLHANSTTKDMLTTYQCDGLCQLRRILLVTISSSSSSSSEEKSEYDEEDGIISHIPKKLLIESRQQGQHNSDDPSSNNKDTNQYLLSEFGGMKKEPSSRWKLVKKAVSTNSIIQELRRECTSKNDNDEAILPHYSAAAPVEWYQLDYETQLKLYHNHLSWENLMRWEDFDIFEVSKLCQGKPLLFVGWAILASPHSQIIMEETVSSSSKKEYNEDDDDDNSSESYNRKGYNFLETYKIPPKCMIDFLRAIEDRYLPDTINPYHNNIHAADVLQTTHSFLEMGSQYQLFDGGASPPTSALTLQMFSLLVGAAIHDVGHPGYNNAFQSKTFSQIALTYNDKSILENYHTSLAFQMVLGENAINSEWNIFKNMIPGEFVECKRFITEAILDTDMTFHFARYNEIKTLSIPSRNNINTGNDNDDDVNSSKDSTNKEMAYSWKVLKFILHMADISNLAKRQSISNQWTDCVLEEFFRQGDQEREMGLLPISPLCDRNTTSRADSQMGFISFVIRPSFEALQRHLPYTTDVILPLIKNNYEFWESQKNTEEEKSNNKNKTKKNDAIKKDEEKAKKKKKREIYTHSHGRLENGK